MTTFLEAYKAQLDQIVQNKLAGTQATGNSDLANALALLRQQRGPAVGYGANFDPTQQNPSLVGRAKNAAGTVLHSSAAQRILDVMSRGDYAAMNTIKEMSQPGTNDENIAEAFWKGLSGKEKTTGSDVLRQNYPNMGNKTRAITGFVGDVFLDPTTYVGAGAIKSLGKGAVKGLEAAGIKVGKKAAEEAVTTPAAKALSDIAETGAAEVPTKTANSLLDFIAPEVQRGEIPTIYQATGIADKAAEKVAKETPTAPVKALKAASDAEVLAARSAVDSANNMLGTIKPRRYAKGTKIAPAYKSVTRDVVEETPTPAPVVAETPTPAAATKATKGKGLSKDAADENAYYKYLISNPDAKISVKAGGRDIKAPVSRILADVKAGKVPPEIAKTMLKQEARRLASLSDEAKGGENFMVRWGGRSGAPTNLGIPASKFSELLQGGTVGKSLTADFYEQFNDAAKIADDPLRDVTIHDKSDFKNLTVPNMSGTAETLGNYLTRKKVRTTIVDPTAAGKAVPAPPSGLGDVFDNAPTFPSTKNAVTQAPKVTKVTEYKKLTGAEKTAWIASHADILDQADIDLLLKTRITAKSAKAWDDAVASILSRQADSGFQTVDDLMSALENGTVEPSDLKDLMKLLRVRKPENIPNALQKLLTNAENLENQAGKARAAAMEDIWTAPAAEPIPVKPAEKIVENVIKDGDKTDLVSMKQQLDSAQVQDLQAGISHIIQREIIDPTLAEKYGFRTAKGVRRTAPTMNVGVGRKYNQWNKFSQLTVVDSIIKFRTKQVAETLRKAGLKGDALRNARSSAMYDHVMPVMRTIDELLKENGIPPMLGNNPAYVASLTDVLDSMPESFVKRHFFDVTKSPKGAILHEHIPPTFWNDIGEVLMDHANGLIDEFSASDAVANILTATQKTRNQKEIFTGVSVRAKQIAAKSGDRAASDYVEHIATDFVKAAPRLAQTVQNNIAKTIVHDVNGAGKVSKEAYDAFVQLVTSPGFTGHDLLRVAEGRDAIVESIAKSAGVVSENAKRLATADVLVKTSDVIPPEVAAAANDAKKVAAAVDNGKNVTRPLETALDNTEAAVKQVQMEVGESLTDIGLNAERTMGYSLLRSFAPHLGNKDVRKLFLDRNSFGQTISRTYAAMFSNLARSFPKEDIQAAWRELQMGTRANPETPVGAAQLELEKAVDSIFNDDETFNIFKHNGLTPAQVNSHFDKYGIPDKLKFEESGNFTDWRLWDVNDPLDTMSRVQAAVQASITERTLGADLSRRFGSKTKTGEYTVKIVPGKGSILARFLDKDMYFTRDMAQQFGVLDHFMREAAQPNTAHGILRLYDGVIHSLKSGYTIYRLGHHVRNMVGDVWLSWMDGVNTIGPYRKALNIMAQNKGRYNDFDALRALQSGGETITPPKATDTLLKTRIGGKATPLTSGQVYEMAYKRGILPDYRTLEDIQFGGDSAFKMPKVFGGKIHHAAASLSEARDHYARLAHFIDILEKGKFKSLEDAADQAAHRVRKWHPDGSDLTHFESKAMRRGFLFYSWIRKAIPLVAESMVMKPGKIMAYPKAMYALAESMGIDPQSFGDPFPTDQLFPSWLADNVTGPAFGNANEGYWGISPGIPAMDVLNDYGTGGPQGFLRTVVGSSTPVAKIPLEVATGQDIRIGAPITDTSDYIDRQIPGVNVLSNLTNRSVSSLGTQSTGVGNGMSPEQIAKAQEKNNPGLDSTALINYLTGLGLIDMSKPSLIKQAQFEQRRR
jgi:hypothetical protein